MSPAPPPAIAITLTPLQVEHVLRIAGRSADGSRGAPWSAAARTAAQERRLSRSLLRGIALLSCFDDSSSERGVVELARIADLSPSTTHRYAQTLLALGLLERCPHSRRYRLAAALSDEPG